MSASTRNPTTAVAAGIDLGGTKIESTLFDSDFLPLTSRRQPTPGNSYSTLLKALETEVQWLRHEATQKDLPIGIGIPGLVDPQTGISVSANLTANGQTLAQDLMARAGGTIVSANDCKCFALSEACGGAGENHSRVFGLILGTGLGGGLCQDGQLVLGYNGLPGEVGHYGLPAHIVIEHDLPLLKCGCGRIGCTETLISGTGIAQLSLALTGNERSAVDIASAPDEPDNSKVLEVWSKLAAEMLHTIQLHIDPDCIVLGGGLSNIVDLETRLTNALNEVALPSVRRPEILKPAFGDSSGGRGAALLSLGTEERTDHEPRK
ncbi:ROK family protein [Lentilitoribacter sp. EG35]|jgi:predicted NBD/HSP70 family sugar kinase|uniref:ROK family protein n=1 Tax=Lentilitoribacter sp. EG35 TaxID=3234192 RepID=UPI0034615245